MYRYRLLMAYEEKITQVQVVQVVIVIADNDLAAVQWARADLAKDAVGGRAPLFKVLEKARVATGVVFRGEPYIPINREGLQG